MFVCLRWSGILANQAMHVCSLETFRQDNWQEIELGAATIFSRLSNHASLVSRLGQSGFCLPLQKAVSVGVRWVQASVTARTVWRAARGREKWHTSTFVCFCLPTAGRVRADVSWTIPCLCWWPGSLCVCKGKIWAPADATTSLCLISGPPSNNDNIRNDIHYHFVYPSHKILGCEVTSSPGHLLALWMNYGFYLNQRFSNCS